MEPRQVSPEISPNLPPASLERSQPIEAGIGSNEVLPARRNEQAERQMGQRIEAVAQSPVVPQLPTLPPPVVDNTTQILPVVDPTSPSVAADDDLIEKEWVDRAKQIIASTKDDPYRREQEVKKLQLDYVRKRYGREIGDTND